MKTDLYCRWQEDSAMSADFSSERSCINSQSKGHGGHSS